MQILNDQVKIKENLLNGYQSIRKNLMLPAQSIEYANLERERTNESFYHASGKYQEALITKNPSINNVKNRYGKVPRAPANPTGF
jgi:hypothetical protein